MNQSTIILQEKDKRKYRNTIVKGLLCDNIYYYTHHYRNIMLMISLIFEVDKKEYKTQIIERFKQCKDKTLKIISQKQNETHQKQYILFANGLE